MPTGFKTSGIGSVDQQTTAKVVISVFLAPGIVNRIAMESRSVQQPKRHAALAHVKNLRRNYFAIASDKLRIHRGTRAMCGMGQRDVVREELSGSHRRQLCRWRRKYGPYIETEWSRGSVATAGV